MLGWVGEQHHAALRLGQRSKHLLLVRFEPLEEVVRPGGNQAVVAQRGRNFVIPEQSDRIGGFVRMTGPGRAAFGR